jgi:hypothetical protein
VPFVEKKVMNFTFAVSTDICVGHTSSLATLRVPRFIVVFSQQVDALQIVPSQMWF